MFGTREIIIQGMRRAAKQFVSSEIVSRIPPATLLNPENPQFRTAMKHASREFMSSLRLADPDDKDTARLWEILARSLSGNGRRISREVLWADTKDKRLQRMQGLLRKNVPGTLWW